MSLTSDSGLKRNCDNVTLIGMAYLTILSNHLANLQSSSILAIIHIIRNVM